MPIADPEISAYVTTFIVPKLAATGPRYVAEPRLAHAIHSGCAYRDRVYSVSELLHARGIRLTPAMLDSEVAENWASIMDASDLGGCFPTGEGWEALVAESVPRPF